MPLSHVADQTREPPERRSTLAERPELSRIEKVTYPAPPPAPRASAEHRRDADADYCTEATNSLQTIFALRIDQVKNPGRFKQITQSKPSRIRQKTMEPF